MWIIAQWSCNLKNGEQHILEWYIVLRKQHVWIWTATVRDRDWTMDFRSVRMPAVLTSQSPKVMSPTRRAPEMDLQPVTPALACGAWWWKRLPSSPAVIPSSVQDRHLLRAADPKKEGKSHLSLVKSPLNSLPKETLRRPQTSNELGAWILSPMRHSAAAAAKSLQSCPTLCDPIDGSPPGSPVPGILQARTLEWVAFSFSDAWKWKVKVKLLSHVWLFVTPWTAAYQAPLPMGFSRQEYWSGLPLPSPNETLRRPQTSNKLGGSQKENSQFPFSSPYQYP